MATPVAIGDVLEFITRTGSAYAHYTHRHRRHGGLIRVFDSIYAHRPADLAHVVADRVRLSTFVLVGAFVSRGILAVAGHAAILPEHRQFPTFRAGVVDPATGKVATWWFWDGEREWRVGEITAEQRRMPIRGVWNDTLLIERIESGWTPETDGK